MARIPFDVTKRPQIESGEYKVETKDGRKVKIISFECTDTDGCPIAGQFRLCAGTPTIQLFDEKGYHKGEGDSDYTLFIITPEPDSATIRNEMKEFIDSEKQLVLCSESDGKACIKWDAKSIDDVILLLKDGIDYLEKKKSFREKDCRYDYRFATHPSNQSELTKFEVALEQMMYDWEDKGIEGRKIVAQHINDIRRLAREEIVKSGYAIVEGEHYLEEGRKNYERGKEEAMKDLPRWRKWVNGAAGNSDGHPIALVSGAGGIRFVSVLGITGEKYIMLDDLKKLPGFKEEEK